MTSDEINRAIEFLLQHQANAAARMDETDIQMKEAARQIQETGRQIRVLNSQMRKLTDSTSRFQEDIKGFIKILVPLLEGQSRRLDRLEGHT